MTDYVVKVVHRSEMADAKDYIYMYTKWLEDTIKMQFLLTKNNRCYIATLKHDEISQAAEELEQNFETYFDECKKALTTHLGCEEFQYDLDEDEGMFRLYKCVGFETLYVEVVLGDAPDAFPLLDAAIAIGQREANIAAEKAAKLVETSSKTPQELINEYERYIKDSKKQEQTLLKKFLLLINTKKERIQELERKLENKPSDNEHNESTESDVEGPEAKKMKPKNKADEEKNVEDMDFEAATEPLPVDANI